MIKKALVVILLLFSFLPKSIFASAYDQTISTRARTSLGNDMVGNFFRILNIPSNFVIKTISFEVQFNQNVTDEALQTRCLGVDQFLYFSISYDPIHSYYFIYHNPVGNKDKKTITFDISSAGLSTQEVIASSIYVGEGVYGGYFCGNDNFSAAISSGEVANNYISPWNPTSSLTPVIYFNLAEAKTPVLIVPGVLGTDIQKGNNKLWLDLGHNLTDIGDEFMDPLQFVSKLSPFDNTLSIGEIVGKPNILFDYSDGLTQEFQNQGYHQGTSSTDTLFTFPYDWRYGVSGTYANGSTTVDFLAQKIEDIRKQTGSDKVDVIAHSTGGLLVKKYVIDHPSDNRIGKAVFVGVPNTGAPKAIKTLLKGDNFGIPWLADSEMQKISKNLPVVYDLLPSQKYFDTKGSFLTVTNHSIIAESSKNLDFNQTKDFLINDHNLNGAALTNAVNLHSTIFDNFDLRTAGVDLYSIIGCKSATIKTLQEVRPSIGGDPIYYLHWTPGDGTVPIESATNLPINNSNKYYSLNADHGKMPSQEGIRQQIVNIISGSHLPTQSSVLHRDLITQDISKCGLNGKAISIYSPLNADITDQDGNHSGVLSDGSVQNNIPNADFEIMGEHKFVYLPTDEGQTYSIHVNGTGIGTFTIKDQDIQDDNITQTQIFSNLPVTPALTGQVNLGSDGTSLTIQTTATSTPVVIQPSSVIGASESEDITPPVATSTITGLMGQAGYYRGNVNINLSAQDPVIPEQESQTSGVLNIHYSLDNSGYQIYSSSSPISITTEGQHVLSFFSTDRAGNNEQEQFINFTIDKTPPEFSIQFNPSVQDLYFAATDTFSTKLSTSTLAVLAKKGFHGFLSWDSVKVKESDDIILATDAAGNTTQINLQSKDRKRQTKADIKSLSYNGKQADLSKNLLHFDWLFDKKGNLTLLTQQAQSKKEFNIFGLYTLNKTLITGKDQTGKINKTFNGLTLLKISTNKGDLNWSY